MTKTPIDIYVSDRNMKVPVPLFNIPARTTCKGCTIMCSDECYAAKAERVYPGVLPRRKLNLKASLKDTFVDDMVVIIMKKGQDWFRIHESGDFYDQEYLDKWIEICRQLPYVKFLAFTKAFTGFGPNKDQGLDFSEVPDNLQIIWSVWPDTEMDKIPPGPRAYAGDMKFRKGEKVVECPGKCEGCMVCWGISKIHMSVHFKIH